MYENFSKLSNEVINCKKCKLCTNRINTALGKGNENADIMFIVEGLGVDEDKMGVPFAGSAGILLDMALNGLEISKEDIYIANIVKCRPLQNRNPEKDEIDACLDYLRNEVILVKPKIIILLGSIALNTILNNSNSITNMRGKWIEKKGILYMPMYHPAALLRDGSKKIEFWYDLKKVKEKYIEILKDKNVE